jgi:hypothetical protein
MMILLQEAGHLKDPEVEGLLHTTHILNVETLGLHCS